MLVYTAASVSNIKRLSISSPASTVLHTNTQSSFSRARVDRVLRGLSSFAVLTDALAALIAGPLGVNSAQSLLLLAAFKLDTKRTKTGDFNTRI